MSIFKKPNLPWNRTSFVEMEKWGADSEGTRERAEVGDELERKWECGTTVSSMDAIIYTP